MNPQCHVISISGGKGGVGKSVFAANFALALMSELKQRVLLIDLDSQSCGDQNVILGLRPTKTVSEVSTFTGTINAQTISTLVTQHPTGLHFIGAVRTPGENCEVNTEGLKRALTSLSNMYQYIVVDLGTQLLQPQYTVLEVSSACLVLTLPEMLATNQTAKFISQLTTNMFHSDMLLAVVNKMPNPPSLAPQAIEQVLRRRLLGIIPQDDNLVNASLSKSQPFFMSQPRAPISIALTEMIRRLSQGGFLEKLRTLNKPKASSIQSANVGQTGVRVLGAQSVGSSNAPSGAKKSEGFDVRTALKRRLLVGLLDVVDLKKVSEVKDDPVKEQELRVKTQAAVAQLLEKENGNFSREERAQLVKEVMDEALGLGPLEDLLADESVSEIMVNRRDMIFVEKKGRIQKVDVSFSSEQQLRLIIERIVSPLGRQINDSSPYVDARLKDGSRVNAVIPPVSIDGSCITIRKFAKVPITWKDYATFGTLTEPMIDFLRICIENKLNVIISGGTGSGKTTLLNVLSGFIPSNERIVTIEDAAELQLKQDHVIRLETKPGNSEGAKPVDIRTLVKNSLRMRPDRIVVGECRGGEALDMLSAMNTGHDGSLTTVHANNPREAIGRLETLCLMAGMDLPARAIREQIAGAVDLIIQISRLSDGSRKVISIAEVVGMQGEVVTMSEIYKFKETGFDKDRKILGQFMSTGTIPSFIEEFERRGVKIPRTLFAATPSTPTGKTA